MLSIGIIHLVRIENLLKNYHFFFPDTYLCVCIKGWDYWFSSRFAYVLNELSHCVNILFLHIVMLIGSRFIGKCISMFYLREDELLSSRSLRDGLICWHSYYSWPDQLRFFQADIFKGECRKNIQAWGCFIYEESYVFQKACILGQETTTEVKNLLNANMITEHCPRILLLVLLVRT